MLDPRGYGDSQGDAGIDGIHLDANEALNHLAATACGEIIVFGQSLGGALAIYTVSHSEHARCVRGVISEGAFSSYRDIAREKLDAFWVTWPLQWPLSFLVSDEYSPKNTVAEISPVPLLLIHGEQDTIIPTTHATRLFEAAHEPRELWLVPNGGHITAALNPEHRKRLVQWMAEAVKPAARMDARVTSPEPLH
jgi:hypothetical protein